MNWKFKNLDAEPPVEITVTLPAPDPAKARKTGARRAWEDLIFVADERIAQCKAEPQLDPYTDAWTEGYRVVYEQICRRAQRALDDLEET